MVIIEPHANLRMAGYVRSAIEDTNKLKVPKDVLLFGIMTIILGLLPFVIFALETWMGILASKEAWFLNSENHGP